MPLDLRPPKGGPAGAPLPLASCLRFAPARPHAPQMMIGAEPTACRSRTTATIPTAFACPGFPTRSPMVRRGSATRCSFCTRWPVFGQGASARHWGRTSIRRMTPMRCRWSGMTDPLPAGSKDRLRSTRRPREISGNGHSIPSIRLNSVWVSSDRRPTRRMSRTTDTT